ncbi:LacI family transcriptional regulator [Actinacidiphila glaucinigra]|uniref:LacI family transcriptional regulator n=1 Tax=Actinacidiphila glaucinigra TaxID=235986 RepID=A0A239JLT5_9ACTN|nr:LacI family transcriptional regulator [Actinacidiphila glaucinigra]
MKRDEPHAVPPECRRRNRTPPSTARDAPPTPDHRLETRENRLSQTTIRDVAAAAGVSASTVSNFFHHPGKLTGATRERVRQAVEALGFVPNHAARTLRTGTNPVIGYIAADLVSAGASETTHAIERRIAHEGMHLLMANGSTEEGERSYLRLFAQQRVAGIIIAPVGDVEPELSRIRAHGIPSVVITRPATSTTQASVSTDHALAGRIAVEHLVGQGRRRLGFVSDDLGAWHVQDQLRGAVGALGAAPGIALEVIRAADGSLNAGIACAEAIAQRPQEERPDALYCTNGSLAVGTTRVFAAGPGTQDSLDVAVIGYDAGAWAPLAGAPVTAVRAPHQETGLTAVNLLFDRIAKPHQAARAAGALTCPHVRLAPELVLPASMA